MVKLRYRPHLLFFDELYDEQHYQKHSVLDLCGLADVIVVIGDSLQHGLPAGIVGNAILKDIPLIEINPDPEIEIGRTLIVKENAE